LLERGHDIRGFRDALDQEVHAAPPRRFLWPADLRRQLHAGVGQRRHPACRRQHFHQELLAPAVELEGQNAYTPLYCRRDL
jgi:hypothetical protein